MKALKTIIVICISFLFVCKVHSSEETEQKQFEKLYKAKSVQQINLQIIFDPLINSLSFVINTKTSTNIKVMPFTMGANYLLIKTPNGEIIKIASFRRGRYTLYDILPEKQKIMRTEKINKFIKFNIAPRRIFGKYEILWCIDLFQGDKKNTYTSNLIIINFRGKRMQKELVR